MAARRSRMSGDFKLRRTLRNIHTTMDNELVGVMQQSADRVLATMRQLIPKDTGAASAALKVFVSKSGLNAEIGIRGKRDNERFFYLRFLEYGTKGYSGTLYRRADRNSIGGEHTNNRDKSKLSGRRNVLRARDTKNKSDGAHFFGKYPDIPARPAHPWLRPAKDVNREFVLANIRAAVAETLRKASEGLSNG
ncbi:HK97-gp10 family putative phage morphogenesis protein [Pseudomonas vancouverensis]|uniref:HK97 gp10 family phage protein n=1 Tax=Pseudomonas vancouverensis TaxID=95300 RepID=A0A1H2MX52_PSEVA|nr:HK97-gp10 family putative phage morphogenesis protein [Pseudomonas vancouverensis]KAB0489642.1 HK97 gp10 family phage protein [Pseudomonas vancouverensis]TDB69288.1 HK97 gp10 family phage protein [Pseudomonas vancouverensis]SDU97491.1 phage protein, HK97 gp10 family [Pseudomonas vancouverensis]